MGAHPPVGRRPDQGAVLKPVTFSPARGLRVAGEPRPLQPSRTRLLVALLAGGDELVPYPVLISAVAQRQAEDSPEGRALLAVHVSAIRDALTGGCWTIDCVLGRGYRLRRWPPQG